MADLFYELLPLAVVLALSPLAVLAVAAMLVLGRSPAAPWGFALGWCGGLALIALVVLVLGTALSTDELMSQVVGVVMVVLGVAAVALALRMWLGRSSLAASGRMSSLLNGDISPQVAARLGVVTGALNPKALLICPVAAVDVQSADLTVLQNAMVLAAFTVIASSTVVVPVAANALWDARARPALEAVRCWLAPRAVGIAALVLLLVGALLVVNGLSEVRR